MRYMGKAEWITQARRKDRGAAAVEFALVIGVLLLIVAGIIEFGRAFWYYDALTKATRDGARFLTTAPSATINSAAVPAARTMVVNAAHAANVPEFTLDHVSVTCQDAAFQPVVCQDGAAPANVRMAITGYSVTIGGWIGFALPGGGVATFTPHTAMRYMCTGTGTTCY